MQATLHRRLVSHQRAALAVAFAVVIAAIVIIASLVFSTAPSPTVASVQGAAQAQSSYGYMDMRTLEDNIWQVPYMAPRALSYDEITFIESNTFQISYSAPARSYAQMRFIEENTLGFHKPTGILDAFDCRSVWPGNDYVAMTQTGCAVY